MQGVGIRADVEGIQRCFYMDIQRFERGSIEVSITLNWIRYYYTIGTSGQVHIISKLCYNSQINKTSC